MDTVQIQNALEGLNSFLGVYASDLLPLSIAHTGTVIVNTDPHTEPCNHWQAIHFHHPHRSSSGYFFDSYGRYPHIPSILDFIRRHFKVWQYNRTQLQGPMTAVCGEYCCLFALYMDRGYTPQQFEGPATLTKRSTSYSAQNSGPTRCANIAREEGNAVRAYIKGKSQPNLFHSVFKRAPRCNLFVLLIIRPCAGRRTRR